MPTRAATVTCAAACRSCRSRTRCSTTLERTRLRVGRGADARASTTRTTSPAWALEQVDLADVGDKPVGQFSKGMRQRVKVACGARERPGGADPRRAADRTRPGAAPTADRAVPPARRRRSVRARVEPRARRGEPARIAGARHRPGPAGGERRLPRPPRADGRSPAPHPPRRVRPPPAGDGARRAGLVGGLTLDADSVTRRHERCRRRSAGALAPIAVELGVRLTEVNPLDDDLESVFRYLVERR